MLWPDLACEPTATPWQHTLLGAAHALRQRMRTVRFMVVDADYKLGDRSS